MNNKQKYIELCKKEPIPIFLQPFWLDSVCEDGMEWDVVLYEKGGEVWGSFVYIIKKKYGFTLITMPKFTQISGPYIKYPKGQKYYKKLSWEKEVMNYFIDNLPQYDYFNMNFHYSYDNWLPFYWHRFKQTTRYTYVIEKLDSIEEIVSKFSHAKRKQIKKAQKNNINISVDSISPEDFYKLHKMELKSENAGEISYSYGLLKNMYDGCKKNNSGAFFVAKDIEDNIHGALFVIWNEYSAYNLISAFNPKFLSSGFSSLIINDVLYFLKEKGIKRFDFEGSMIEGVENSFRQFNTTQKQYFNISKTNSKILRLKTSLKDMVKAIIR